MPRPTCLVALLQSAYALKELVFEGDLTAAAIAHIRSGHRYVQTLGNEADVQYWGDFEIGKPQQVIRGIMDTGSFELVTFAKDCLTCGKAAKYDRDASRTYKRGKQSKTHSYGSGDCTCEDGSDDVNIGPLCAYRQHFWVAQNCRMPLLAQASFQAIVGLGPPGQPEYTAKEKLKEKKKDPVAGVGSAVKKAEEEVTDTKKQKDLLENLGVKVFSQCLNKGEGEPGYLTWNDQVGPEMMEVVVKGNVTWSASLKDWTLGSTKLGCRNGCAALVDTGTSLFGVPTELYNKMEAELDKLNGDCSDLSTLPDLTMKLDGHLLKFPPQSYVGPPSGGEMNSDVQRFMRRRNNSLGNLRRDGATDCELQVMDIGQPRETAMGPMLILGMPFFRWYYTTFDLADCYRSRDDRHDRRMWLAPAIKTSDGKCGRSDGPLLSKDQERSDEVNTPRRLDVSKLRVPDWIDHLEYI